MVKSKKGLRFYIIIGFFLSLIIFSSGLSIGFLFNDFKQKDMHSDLNSLNELIQTSELEILLFDFFKDELDCDYYNKRAEIMSSQAFELGLKVSTYEDNNGFLNEEYFSMKRNYMNMLIKNWIAIEQSKKMCNFNYTTILYFYINIEDCPKCSEQGVILSRIKSLYGNEVMIYSLDSTLDVQAINILEEVYNINNYPSLIINNELYEDYVPFSKLKNILE